MTRLYLTDETFNIVSIYPTGTTLCRPDKCWNGYTLLGGANLVDMNGRLRKSWDAINVHAKLLPDGQYNAVRPYSRVLEIDPITFELKWEYSAKTAGYGYHHHYVFYSPYVSSAQRLPNGNTLICEGDCRRIIEITSDHDIVWEYIMPPNINENYSYRAYRVPYDWVQQLESLRENPVEPPDISDFHIGMQD